MTLHLGPFLPLRLLLSMGVPTSCVTFRTLNSKARRSIVAAKTIKHRLKHHKLPSHQKHTVIYLCNTIKHFKTTGT